MENGGKPFCCSLSVWFGHRRSPPNSISIKKSAALVKAGLLFIVVFSGVSASAEWPPFAAAGPPRPFVRCLLQLRKRIRQVFQCPGQRFPSTVCFRRAITLIWKRKFSDARIYAIGITSFIPTTGRRNGRCCRAFWGDGAGSHNHAAFLVRLWL